MTEIPERILREYDIRGLVPGDLSPQVATVLGRAFGTRIRQVGGTSVAVARDGRLSSPLLQTALVDGLVGCGLEVQLVGMGPTPLLYFSSMISAADGAVMITGSHNPKEYNGMKMVLRNRPFFGNDIRDLRRIAERNDFIIGPASHPVPLAAASQYVNEILSEVKDMRPLRVVWDCGNGATGIIVTQIVENLAGEHTVLYGTVDGNFPNHHPDPTDPDNLVHLKREVAYRKADLGIAFDGDGDRIGVIDARGRVVWGDQLLLLFAEDVLKQIPGSTIIVDVKVSRSLLAGITAAGGAPLLHPTGHSLIKTKMKEIAAPLAGEMSGHIFFADRWYGFDDAIYAAVRLLRLVSAAEPGWLERRLDGLPPIISTPEIRIACPDDHKFGIITAVKQQLEAEGTSFVAIDGIRVEMPDGWWLLRASNTQPALIGRCEAATEAKLASFKLTIQQHLKRAGLITLLV